MQDSDSDIVECGYCGYVGTVQDVHQHLMELSDMPIQEHRELNND